MDIKKLLWNQEWISKSKANKPKNNKRINKYILEFCISYRKERQQTDALWAWGKQNNCEGKHVYHLPS